MDESDHLVLGIFIGVIVILILGVFVIAPIQESVKTLGGAICDKEYHMDFDQYDGGKLYCKSKNIDVKYDGLSVVVTSSPP